MQELSKWHMHRLGLVDFWYYVNEEFHFKDGHMLLRGSNGSGKSVTMQSFIPLILDGNKSSERLDPFGTRSRKIENYLLEEGSNRDSRIAYLYLEFKRANSDIYKTIGMGLHAKKGRPVETWYFIIEDNRRIGHDISLMQDHVAITRIQLKNIIGEEQLINSQGEYMERVNQSLFGFESSDSYKEAISLLLKLRTPKLSNSLKPTVINDMLRESLQPLSEDDLRPMSEAISNMDSIQDILDNLNQSYQSAKAIQLRYDQYNHDILANKLEKYQLEKEKLQRLEKENKICHQDIEQANVFIDRKEQEKLELEQEQQVLKEEQNSLMDNDLKRLNDDVIQLQNNINEFESSITNKQELKDSKDQQRIDISNDVTRKKNDCDSCMLSLHENIKELNQIYTNVDFSEHLILKNDAWNHFDEKYDYNYVNKLLQNEIKQLNEGITLFQKQSNIKESIKTIYDEKEELVTNKENSEKDLEHTYQQFEEEKALIIENVDLWQQHNKVFLLSKDEKNNIFQCIQDYEDDPSQNKLRESLMHTSQKIFKQLLLQRNDEDAKLQILYKEKEEKYKELQMWKEQKDAQPQCSDKVIQHRLNLEKHHIDFIPLYKLLEFSDEVAIDIRNRFEEMLVESDLLNAIIIHESDIEKLDNEERCSEHYLLSAYPVNELTSFYLYGTKMDELNESLQICLKNMGIKGYQNLQMKEYFYQQGMLTGSITGQSNSIYIGEKSRMQYRLHMIENLESEFNDLQNSYDKQEQICNNIIENINLLEIERNQFPVFDKLNDIYQESENIQLKIQSIISSIRHVESRIEKISTQLKEVNQQLRELAEKLTIPMEMDRFLEKCDHLIDYEKTLHLVINSHNEYILYNELYESLKNRLEEIDDYLDDLNSEIIQLQLKNSTAITMLKNKQKQLIEKGYDKVKERMDYVNERLNKLPSEIINCASELATTEERVRTLLHNKEDLENKIELQSNRSEQYSQIVYDEIKLFYVIEKSDNNDVDLLKLAEEKIKNYQWKYKRENISELLHESFYNNRGALQEYNPTLTRIPLKTEVEGIRERSDIIAKHGGKRLTFMELIEKLERDINIQKTLLVDQDRELYEDILVNTISKKIRNRIRSSHNWVSEMNRYMDAMNTSSGLKLNLSWKAKKAENEEEMDTREVVELLEKDSNVLKEKDLQRLSRHFRSKIETARKIRDYDDNTLSFHQLMKEVMDYRKWFEFKILSQKTGEAKKELTNNAFYAYSGGEKAMSMYVPLFSAIAAKFASAKKDAPMLIALDEAFAGVDEKNIDNMFALIYRFGFDYIMNSQVLWGDYPSVSSLAIYELFRPENAKYVTVIAYEWDGFVKRLKS